MVNNIDTLRHLLKFDNENQFYLIQIFQRRKDNPDMKLGVRRIKSYCVYSQEQYDGLVPSIIEYCHRDNARAYLRLNKQHDEDITLRCIEQLVSNMRHKTFRKGRNVWDSVSGQGGAKDFWVLDVDKEHLEDTPTIVEKIKEVYGDYWFNTRNERVAHTWLENSTKSGIHIILPPFDVRILKPFNEGFSSQGIPIIQINKDGNTLLYA